VTAEALTARHLTAGVLTDGGFTKRPGWAAGACDFTA